MMSRFPLYKDQKEKVKKLKSMFAISETEAYELLEANYWSLERASEVAIERSVTRAIEEKTNASFNAYKDPTEDAILVDGLTRYCEDLHIDPTDVVMLMIALRLSSPSMCVFPREGFVEGWATYGADTIEKQREAIPVLRAEMAQPKEFKEVYLFTFKYGLAEGQRAMPLETAVAFWELLLPPIFPLLPKWIQFVQEKHKKAISKDTWNLLLEFITTVGEDLDKYDPMAAWPILIDEFVEYCRSS